jgi:hypothetical protein
MDGWPYRVRGTHRPVVLFEIGQPEACFRLSVAGWEEQRTTAMPEDELGFRMALVIVAADTPAGSWEYADSWLATIDVLRGFALEFRQWVTDGRSQGSLEMPDDESASLFFDPLRNGPSSIEVKVTPSCWLDDDLHHGRPKAVVVRTSEDRLLAALEHFLSALDVAENMPVDETARRFESRIFLALPPFSAPGELGGLVLGDANGAISLRFVRTADWQGGDDVWLHLEVAVVGPVAWRATFLSWILARDVDALARWIEIGDESGRSVGAFTGRSLSLERSRTGGETLLTVRPGAGPGVMAAAGDLRDITFAFTPSQIAMAADSLRAQAVSFREV